MTVKCLNDLEKVIIAGLYVDHGRSIDSLATEYKRSRRTIIRTLEEQGVNPGIKRRNRKSKAPLTIHQNYTPGNKPAGPTVIPTHTPWYRRIIDKVAPLFS